jgi:hypothetical protein
VAKRELRAIIAQRYLADENFIEGKKFATAAAFTPDKLKLIDQLERLTNESSGAKEKPDAMMKTGDAWAAARGQLLRAPLDARIHLYHRAFAIPGLTRRDNGQALHYGKVEDQLDDRDELHHAARWWMRAARSAPGSEVSAKARLKALEALPPIARASAYAEQRAREIKLETVSREIYDKLRAEAPKSEEAQRKSAYWSVPALPKSDESTTYIPGEVGETTIVSCEDDACALGYPYSDNEAFQPLLAKLQAPTVRDRYKAEQTLEQSVKALRQSVASLKPEDLQNIVKELDNQLRTNVTALTDAAAVNCFDDLVQFLAEKEVTPEAARIYVNLRLDLLHRARFAEPDPGITGEDKDETVAAEIDEAAKTPAFRNLQDYLDFCRIALVSGAVSNVETDIKDPKDPEHPMTYPSRDFPRLEKMAREFLQKYPKTHKREAAQFVFARSIYSLSCPYIYCVSVPIPGSEPSEEMFDIVKKSYQREPFKPERVMAALDEYDKQYPNGRYRAEVQNLRAATFWRMGEWEKTLGLTMPEVLDPGKGDIQSEACTRLANIFAMLNDAEQRSYIMAAIMAHPASTEYLQAYLGAATKDRAHPLRYLQKYLCDQFHFKLPEADTEVAAATAVR